MKKEYVLYGLDKYEEVIEEIVDDLNVYDDIFDIRLILTEALTNAFIHGNKSRADKPIYLRFIYNGKSVKFEIEDSGAGLKNIIIKEEISDENVLDDCGRGLFLINCIADNINISNNTLIIEKKLKAL